MISNMVVVKPSLSGRNYLLVDLEQLQKEEFAQRRKLRIQQVRLQSKDLASRVLRDVRNERKLHLKAVQNNQANVCNKWHSRKLHEINLVYKENNPGQRAAAELPDPEEEILEQVRRNEEAARERGRKAVAQLKSSKEASRYEREKALSQREKAKTLESIRAAMVSSLPNFKSKRKPDQDHRNAGENARDSVNDPETPAMCTEKEKSKEHGENQTIPVVPELSLPVSVTERLGSKLPATFSRKALPVAEALPHCVEVYDHHNPCSLTQRQHPSVRVEKTSVFPQTNACDAAEIESKEEAERQNGGVEADNEARIIRGKRALAKELVRRDFDRVMNHFDELARHECIARVAEMPKLPPEVYMDEERAALIKKRQQQDLESAFEGVMHGNLAVELEMERSKERRSKETSRQPLVVKATFPEDVELDKTDPVIDTSLPKLNVAICDRASTLGSSGYEACGSSSDPTINSSDIVSDNMTCADTPIEVKPAEKLEEKPCKRKSTEEIEDKELRSEREQLQRRIEIARSSLEEKASEDVKSDQRQKESDEVDHNHSNESGKGSSAWWCTLPQGKTKNQVLPSVTVEEEKPEKEKGKSKRKSSVYKHSFEVKGKTLEELDILLQKAKRDRQSLDSNGTVSSSSNSSWGLEEVRVVLKVDKEPPEGEKLDVEEEDSSRPIVTSHKASGPHKSERERVKWVTEDKLETKSRQVEDKHVHGQERPSVKILDVKVRKKRKERQDIADQATQVGKDSNLMTDGKRRERKGAKAQRTSVEPSVCDTSHVRPPTCEEVMDSDQAKILLEGVKSQRKRLEKWVELQRDSKGKVNRPLRNYIQRLLSMSRESVAELSVSDVSSPVLMFSTPNISDSSVVTQVVEDPLVTKKYEDKSVGTSFDDGVVDQEVQVTLSPGTDEKTVSSASVVDESTIREVSPVLIRKTIFRFLGKEKSHVEALDHDIAKSLAEVKVRRKSPQYDPSVPVRESPSPVEIVPEVHSKPPSPPPPSPEYDELSVLHSKRISLLGAKLMEIREMRKRLMTSFESSSDDSDLCASLSSKSSHEEAAIATQRSDSSKEGEKSPCDVPDGQKKDSDIFPEESDGKESLDSSHSSGRSDEDSEDSLLEKLFLESLTLSEPKKSFRPSEEMKAALKNGSTKAGPPPTALKGGTWIGSDLQIPHELSTIVEVDSRVFSSTSLAGQKKEEYSTSLIGLQHRPEPLEDPLKKYEVFKLDGTRSSELNLETAKEPKSHTTEERKSASTVAEKPFLDMAIVLEDSADAKISPEKTKPSQQDEAEEENKSDVSLPVSFSSLDDSTEFPDNLDDALRILGISPSVLKRRKSSESGDAASSTSSQSGSPGKMSCNASFSPESSPPKVERRESPKGGSSTIVNVGEVKVRGSAGDSEQQKSWLQFTPLGSFKDLSIGTSSSKSQPGSDKSSGRGGFFKEMGLELSNFQSTPIASFKEFAYDSGSPFIAMPQPKVGDILPQGAFRNMGKSFPELAFLREKSSPGLERSNQESPAVPKDTPQSMLRHSTPIHSFSGEGSSSSTSGEQRSRSHRSGFPFLGDSAPSSISGGTASDGADWKNAPDENESMTHEGKGD